MSSKPARSPAGPAILVSALDLLTSAYTQDQLEAWQPGFFDRD
jgi:hypothetical protein